VPSLVSHATVLRSNFGVPSPHQAAARGCFNAGNFTSVDEALTVVVAFTSPLPRSRLYERGTAKYNLMIRRVKFCRCRRRLLFTSPRTIPRRDDAGEKARDFLEASARRARRLSAATPRAEG